MHLLTRFFIQSKRGFNVHNIITPSRTQEDIKKATCSSTAPKIFKTKFKFNSCTTYCREDGNSML
jgi:hypothetical protein